MAWFSNFTANCPTFVHEKQQHCSAINDTLKRTPVVTYTSKFSASSRNAASENCFKGFGDGFMANCMTFKK